MLTQEEIDKIMRLSRLDLTKEEQTKYSTDLSGILDFFKKLQEVNTDGVEPTAQVTGLEDCLRTDTIDTFKESIIASSPQKIIGTQVSVPAVF